MPSRLSPIPAETGCQLCHLRLELAASLILTTLFFLPVLAGLVSVVGSAFHYLPALGFHAVSLSPWQALLATTGLGEMLALTVSSTVLSTLISLLIALGVVSALWGTRQWYALQRSLSPLMAAPHVALAFGVMFVLMPSGLLSRVLASVLGWQSPPLWQTVQDPYGISLILLLVMKETPFLIFMTAAAITRLPVADTLRLGTSMGFQPGVVWLKLLWPQLFPMIRLPVYTVLAFAMSVVDVAQVLGPANPPTFAVQILLWIQDPDLNNQLRAAAGSVLLLLLMVAVIGLCHLAQSGAHRLARNWLTNGHRGYLISPWLWLAGKVWRGLLVLFFISGGALLVWSLVWRWRFPSLWPDWSWQSWNRAYNGLGDPISNSLLIGMISAFMATLIAILLLELQQRQTDVGIARRLSLITGAAMYIPLLLPQVTFLFGVQVLLLRWQLDGQLVSVIGLHLLFVLPYCYLSLSGPWQHYDQRHSVQGLLLSRSWWRTFVRVKVGLLWQPILASFALGFAVSIGQYLPTLLAGAGRIETVTTAAVGLVSGGNRRLIGVYGVIQMVLPLLAYAGVFLLSHWTFARGRLVRRLNS